MKPSISTIHIDELFARLKDAVIMMVDDEPILMEIVQVYLEEEGYNNFILVEDSREAMAKIEAEQPDIVLLDLKMPHVDGFDILAAVQKSDMASRLPIIVLTSSTDAPTKLGALELGATDFLAKPVDSSELALRLRNTLTVKVHQDQLAYYDDLTHLPNRHLFLDRLEWLLKKSHRHQHRLAILNIGLDNFQQVNDSIGPRAGDSILRELATRLLECVRDTDVITHTGVDDLWRQVARLGGDEFSILLPDVEHTDSAAYVARRIQNALAESFEVGGDDVYLTASIGVAVYPEDGEDSDLLIKNASAATAFAKRQGRNILQFYSEEINAHAKGRLAMEADLRKAVENNELILHYQPKVDPRTGMAGGCEALLRWNRPNVGLVPPNDFIPLAEETGLIVPIGEWIIAEACRQQMAWRAEGLGDLTVSINVAGPQFKRDDLHEVLIDAMEAVSMNPRHLKLEITESILMGDERTLIKKMDAMEASGLSFSIDDFGTGYSSLSYLKRFPVSELKIDRSFVIDIPESKDDSAIVRAIIAMAKSLELSVVAEGVEKANQVEFLKDLGCDLIQGYYYSKPVSAARFSELKGKFDPDHS